MLMGIGSITDLSNRLRREREILRHVGREQTQKCGHIEKFVMKSLGYLVLNYAWTANFLFNTFLIDMATAGC